MAGAAYGAQPTHQVVYVNGKPKKKKNKFGLSNTATGVLLSALHLIYLKFPSLLCDNFLLKERASRSVILANC